MKKEFRSSPILSKTDVIHRAFEISARYFDLTCPIPQWITEQGSEQQLLRLICNSCWSGNSDQSVGPKDTNDD